MRGRAVGASGAHLAYEAYKVAKSANRGNGGGRMPNHGTTAAYGQMAAQCADTFVGAIQGRTARHGTVSKK